MKEDTSIKTGLPDINEVEEAIKQIADICHIAWEKDFMAGWSGNASIRLLSNPELLVITAKGKTKGQLKSGDYLLVNLEGEKLSGKASASSESRLHTILYENWPEINAILHTHPPYMQALEIALYSERAGLKSPNERFLNIELHEASIWRKRLYFSGNFFPGTEDLAVSANYSLNQNEGKLLFPCAIWLPFHGLCAAGENLESCLNLSEELEHLAKVQLLSKGIL